MQKVEGSSPFIRFTKAPQIAGFFFVGRDWTIARTGAGMTH
jgi:hypothetical protein